MRFFRLTTFVASCFIPLVILPVAPARASAVDPVALYGKEIQFDVLRDGDKVGAHVVQFARNRGVLSVQASFEIAIRFFGFTVYEFSYASAERWRDGRLIELDARIDDDGNKHQVQARAVGRAVEVDGPAGEFKAPADVLPTNHWNVTVLGSDLVLNTLTGNLNSVRIVNVGNALVKTAAGERAAQYFRYTGELETEVWYDAEGRWVKLRFKAEDGSTIEYVCRRCGGDA